MIDQIRNIDVYIEEIANADDEQTRHEVAARARGYLSAILDFMDQAEQRDGRHGHVIGIDPKDLGPGTGRPTED